MKTIKYSLCLLWLCFAIISLKAQKRGQLNIGDSLPDLTLNANFNWPNGKITNKDLKDKIVIFDFWNTTCTTCIHDFPKLEQLQKKFQNDLMIILVTRDKKEKVNTLFKKLINARTTLPIVTDDSLLIKYFTLKSPHQGWLNQKGKVVAIANSYNATAINVQKVMNGEPLEIPVLIPIANYSYNQPLTQLNYATYQKTLQQSSVFTSFIDGILAVDGMQIDSASGKAIWRSCINKSIFNLCKYAYGGFDDANNIFGNTRKSEQIVLNVKDTTRFLVPKEIEALDNWNVKNLFCYEIKMPLADADLLQKYMQEDLKRYFKLNIAVKYNKIKGLGLFALDKKYLKAGSEGLDYITQDEKQYLFVNQKMDQIVGFLNKLKIANTKITNQTTLMDRFDVKIPIDKMSNLKALKTYLSTIGLELKECEFDEPYLLISDQ